MEDYMEEDEDMEEMKEEKEKDMSNREMYHDCGKFTRFDRSRDSLYDLLAFVSRD